MYALRDQLHMSHSCNLNLLPHPFPSKSATWILLTFWWSYVVFFFEIFKHKRPWQCIILSCLFRIQVMNVTWIEVNIFRINFSLSCNNVLLKTYHKLFNKMSHFNALKSVTDSTPKDVSLSVNRMHLHLLREFFPSNVFIRPQLLTLRHAKQCPLEFWFYIQHWRSLYTYFVHKSDALPLTITSFMHSKNPFVCQSSISIPYHC